jgi:methionyl-tRNA formyltransferase
MDTGAMLLKSTVPIALEDNALDLAKRLSSSAADLLVETLLGLAAGTLQPIPQDNEQATYAPLIQKADYVIDWSKPAIAIHNQIRGFYPNCATTLRDQPLKVLATLPLGHPEAVGAELAKLSLATSEQNSQPGTVIGLIKGLGAVIQTGDGEVLLKEVQLAGKRSQSGWDFVNGTRLQVGEPLG